jgi:hypothetical protein
MCQGDERKINVPKGAHLLLYAPGDIKVTLPNGESTAFSPGEDNLLPVGDEGEVLLSIPEGPPFDVPMPGGGRTRVIVIAPVILLFGIPLGFFTPSGLKEAEEQGLGELLPLFWGANLAFSSAAASIATLVSLIGGYSLTFYVAAGLYILASSIAIISFAGTLSLNFTSIREQEK